MKKFTSLILMLMLVFSGSISAQTLITSLDQLSNNHAYYLRCARGYAYSAANHGQLVASAKDATPNGDDYKFVIYKDADNYYLYNLGAGFFCKKNDKYVGFSVDKLENVTFEKGADATYPWTIFINSGGNKKRFNHNNQGGLLVNYETVDAGNQWQIIDAGETGITELPKIVTDIATLSSSKKYVLTTIRGALYGNGNGNGMSVSGTNPFVNDNYCFTPYKDNDGKCYLYNVGGNSFVSKSNNTAKLELRLKKAEITFGPATGNASYPHTISVDGNYINHSSGWVNTNYQIQDNGNRWMIVEVGAADETAVSKCYDEALLNDIRDIANTCLQNNADYEGNANLQSAIDLNVYESTDDHAQRLAKMDALKEAIIAYNVKAPVKYLSGFEGLPGTGYNDETDNNAYRYKWNSETLSFPTPVKKLRFKVLETNTKGASNGHQFFSIGEFRVLDASGKEVSLNAENFVTNAQESTEGSLENICDKKTSTFFHSTWSADTYEDHFIQIELPEEMSELKLSFDSRNGNNVPTLVVLTSVTTANEQAELKAQIDAAAETQKLYETYKNGNLIGNGLNQTTSFTTFAPAYAKANEINTKGETATSAEITSARLALLNACSTFAFSLNKPANGTFIRIHSSAASQAAMPYLSSETSTAKPNRAAYLVGKDGENEAKTIFFYNGNKLLAYETGYYLENISNFAGYKGITTGTSIQFSEAANRAAGCYNVKFNGNRFLYTQVSGSNYFTDAANSAPNDGYNGYNFQMEYVESLPLSVGAAGYATLIAPVALEIPAGVEVYTVAFEDGKAKLTSISDVIPANVGVVVKAAQGTYNFNITTTENVATSALSGVPNTENVASESAAFILANGKHGVGFYKLSSANRTIHGFRAFYTAPAEAQAVSAFLLEDNVTGIEEIETSADKAPIYDLSGRRVAKAEKGVYIQNGRKIFVK